MNFYSTLLLLLLLSAVLRRLLSLHGAWIIQLQSRFFSLADIVYVSLDRDSPPTDVLELARVLITSNIVHGLKEPGIISVFPKPLYKAFVCFSHPEADEFINTCDWKGTLQASKLTTQNTYAMYIKLASVTITYCIFLQYFRYKKNIYIYPFHWHFLTM